MRYTAIALDYDGTIAHDGAVPARVLDGLARLKASGRRLLLVTGRELEGLRGIFPGIALFDLVVAENGALLYDPAKDERRELGEPPPARFVEALKATGIPLAVGHTILATVRPHEKTVLECIAALGLEQQVIFNKGAVMVLPPGCNKASGLKRALKALGLSPRNVVAAGDGENDHAMLDLAEYAVATANAIAPLKEAADYVTRATHGEGVLEVIEGLLGSDLATLPPKRRRRALSFGVGADGAEIVLPSRRASLLVAGEPRDTTRLAKSILLRLAKAGYQVCVADSRGDYADFAPAVVFGTAENPPAVEEILTALDKPEVQVVTCLAAIAPEERPAFIEQLRGPLRELRATRGRPHWYLIDEALDVLPASAEGDVARTSAENVIFVSADPAALPPRLLNAVDGVAACGPLARATLEALAGTLGWAPPAIASGPVGDDEALVWLRRTERPAMKVSLRESAPVDANAREKSTEVGNVLRRA